MENRHGWWCTRRPWWAAAPRSARWRSPRWRRCRRAPEDGRRGQGLRSTGVRRRRAGDGRHAARRRRSSAHSAIDGRTTRHPGYAVSQRIRKRIEEVFGWMKTVGLLRKLRHRGVRAGQLDLHLHRGGLQPGPHAHARGATGVRTRRPDAPRGASRPAPGSGEGTTSKRERERIMNGRFSAPC